MSEPSRGNLEALIASFADRRITVVGHPVLDVYLYGTSHRVSREAPVLIVREDGRELRLGGAANAAANLASLGAKVELVGLVGADEAASQLEALAGDLGIGTSWLTRSHAITTVTKTRILAGGIHTRKQQMLRLDRENPPDAATPEDLDALRAGALEALLSGAEALVVSDYAEDNQLPTYLELVKEAVARGIRVVVDSRFSVSRYQNTTALTPNEPEASAALGLELGDRRSALQAAEALRAKTSSEAVVLTRGKEGMVVARRGAVPVSIPAQGAPEAVDVTGAGDTVTATFTLALAAGGTMVESAVLANAAASLVVQATGAATVSPSQLIGALRGLKEPLVEDVLD